MRQLQSNQSMGDPPSRFITGAAQLALIVAFLVLIFRSQYAYAFVAFVTVVVIAGIDPTVIGKWIPRFGGDEPDDDKPR